MRSRMSAVWSAARTRAMSTGSFACSSSRLGSLAGLGGPRLVDLVGVLGEVGHDDDLVRPHLDEAAADEHDSSVPPFLILSSPMPSALISRV